MLDKDQIAAASQVLVQHWRDGSKLDALETRLRPQSRADGYAVQAALGGEVVRLEDRGNERGRTEAHQCRGTAGRPHHERHRDRRRRHRIDEGQCDARRRAGILLSAWGAICRRARRRIASTRCSPPSTPCIPRSKFRIRASPISPAPARRSSSPTMPARICSCWAPRHQPIGARWISSRSGRRSRCAASAISATARTCSAIPAWRWPGSPTSCAGSASPCGQGRW